jgi:hypothetical protein
MRSLLLLALTFGAAVVRPAGAGHREVRATDLPEGTAVVIVGQVSSPPKGALNQKKMQVAIGPQHVDYTLHFSDAHALRGPMGEEIDEDAFDDGQWVRAEGRIMKDPRRIWVGRIRLIDPEKSSSLQGTPYYRRGFAYGYLAWPAGEARVAGWRGTIHRRAR